MRLAPLQSFEIVMAPKDKTPESVVVGKLAKPLRAGESARLPLTGARDSGDVDLCNDAHIVLSG